VVRVVDGDTFEVKGGYKVRLGSVNAPESREHMGKWATNQVSKLILHKEVTLSYGPTTADHYHRLIADVIVDGKSLEEILLSRGVVHLFVIPPNHPDNYEALVKAQTEAKKKRLGIWGTQEYQIPLHVTSFHANARGDDLSNLQGEYLRIANISGESIDLKGYSITNRRGQKLVFPSLVIPVGYTFQVISGKGKTQGDPKTPYKVFWNSNKEIWNNEGDQATIYDPAGNVILKRDHAPKKTHPN